MAASDKERPDPMALVRSMERELECSICFRDQEDLRCLPCCQQLYCLRCLQGIFSRSDQPECPYCSKVMTKNPEEYAECKLAKHFQRCMTTLKNKLEKGANQGCQVHGCDRPIDFYCRRCKSFLCFRCRDCECQREDDQHNAVDIRDCVVESKETFELWRDSKSQKLVDLISQRQKLIVDAKTFAQQMIASPEDDSVYVTMENIISRLSKAQKELLDNKMEIEEEEASKHMMNAMESIVHRNDEVGLIHFVEQLQVEEQIRQLTLGDYESLVSNFDNCFYDISISPAGQLLIARKGGIDVLHMDNGQHITSIALEEGKYAFAVECCKDVIVVAVGQRIDNIKLSSEVFIYDKGYTEITRWDAPRLTCDLAVVDNRIYISAADDVTSNIKVFTMDGVAQADIPWSGGLAGIISVPPCSIVFADPTSHHVHKQQITSRRRDITWSAPVKVPRCMCLDDNGLVWVRSNVYDCITILSRQGHMVQEIKDHKVTKLGEILDLCVCNDYLYISHYGGTGRFKLYYDPE